MKYLIVLLTPFVTIPALSANKTHEHAGELRVQKPIPKEVVQWIGRVRCKAGSHRAEHDCDLEFVRGTDGEVFDISESPKLHKAHCGANADLMVKLKAEKTSRFLFWGGKLIENEFKVLSKDGKGVCTTAYRAELDDLLKSELRKKLMTSDNIGF